LIPVFESSITLEKNSILIFFQRFFFVFAYTLPFEIRDLKYDLPSLKTIPQIFGVRKAKYSAIVSLLIFIIFSLGLHIQNPVFFYSELLTAFLCAGLIFFSEKNQKKYFSSFLVESLPIFWLATILFFKCLFN
jgi:4-hydroxybenzoate polyprenyltransferase